MAEAEEGNAHGDVPASLINPIYFPWGLGTAFVLFPPLHGEGHRAVAGAEEAHLGIGKKGGK